MQSETETGAEGALCSRRTICALLNPAQILLFSLFFVWGGKHRNSKGCATLCSVLLVSHLKDCARTVHIVLYI